MKKLLILVLFLVSFSSCSVFENITSSNDRNFLYNWGTPEDGQNYTRYDELSYKLFDKQSPETICDLLCHYEYMISHPGGERKVVPPGICAEYGYLLLKAETADLFFQYATSSQKQVFGNLTDYQALFYEKGIKMMEKEMELYPESATFLTPILNQMRH